MKKLFLFAFILLSVGAGKVMAQNIQLHYDLGLPCINHWTNVRG